MPQLTVVGKKTAGHGQWPPVAAVTGDPNITINGMGIVREGDTYQQHCNIANSCHVPTVLPGTGNPNILINGIPAAYVGLVLSCGDVIAEGVGV